MPLAFHNVVLTGACGGLGQALARGLLAQGAQVALVGRDSAQLEMLAALAPGRSVVHTRRGRCRSHAGHGARLDAAQWCA